MIFKKAGKIYWIGVFLLFAGLSLIMFPEFLEHSQEITFKQIFKYTIPGLIPTLIGLYLIEKSNKKAQNI